MTNCDKHLLFSITKKDFKLSFFSGSGAGGQHRNRHMNCVRLQHIDSGAMNTGQSSKSQKANMKEALHNIVKNPKFKVWHSKKVYDILKRREIEHAVMLDMQEHNLKVEYNVGGIND